MDEAQWLGLKKHLAVYLVEVYCCKLCNDFSSTHKTLVATHMQDVHPEETATDVVKPEMKDDDESEATVADTKVQIVEEESGGFKDIEMADEAESEKLVIARQVAENEQIEKTILHTVHAMGSEEGKDGKHSRKKKKSKKDRKKEGKGKGELGRKNKKMCKICGFTTKSSEDLLDHLKTHYKDKDSRTCYICQADFETYKQLIKHARRGCPANSQVYKCEECGKICNDRRAIMEHMVVHSEDRPHACRICGKAYKTKKILRRHEGIHNMSRDTFACPDCNFKTHWKTNIKRHNMEVHKKDARPLFSCPHCPFNTPNKRYIEKHKFGHWKDCPFMCEHCGKMFKSEYEIETHRRTHEEEDNQPDVAWQLIQLQNSEPHHLVEESIVQYQPQIQMNGQDIEIHDHESGLQGAVQVTMTEDKTIVLSQIPVVQYLDIVTGDVVSTQE